MIARILRASCSRRNFGAELMMKKREVERFDSLILYAMSPPLEALPFGSQEEKP